MGGQDGTGFLLQVPPVSAQPRSPPREGTLVGGWRLCRGRAAFFASSGANAHPCLRQLPPGSGASTSPRTVPSKEGPLNYSLPTHPSSHPTSRDRWRVRPFPTWAGKAPPSSSSSLLPPHPPPPRRPQREPLRSAAGRRAQPGAPRPAAGYSRSASPCAPPSNRRSRGRRRRRRKAAARPQRRWGGHARVRAALDGRPPSMLRGAAQGRAAARS